MPTYEFSGPNGKSYSIDGPEGSTPEQAFEILKGQIGLKAEQPAASATSVGADAAKSGGIGLAKGVIGLAGMPGDARNLIGRGLSAAGQKFGLSEETAAKVGKYGAMAAVAPLAGIGGFNPPSSHDIQSGIENVTGKFYEPQTTAGRYAQTVGEFAPGLVGGPGSLLRKGITNVLAPALASETAGQATQDTALEPYARVAGALAGGGGAARAARPRPAAAPEVQEVFDAASAGYKSPEVASVAFKPAAVASLGRSISNDLKRSRFDESRAPQTHGVLDEMMAPPQQTARSISLPTIQSLDEQRQVLGKIAGNFANPLEQAAASNAIAKIDRYLDNIPQSHLLAGDAAPAVQKLKEARGNYASGKAAERVQDKLTNAELRAASTYSGGNLNNATRQNLRKILESPNAGKNQRGFTNQELAAIDQAVRGSTAGNIFRLGGKFLGGGLGAHGFGSAAVGGAVLGFPGIAMPLVGVGLKKVGDYLTRRKSAQIVATILARSPLGQSTGAGARAPHAAPARAALVSALLASPALREQQQRRLPEAQGQGQ